MVRIGSTEYTLVLPGVVDDSLLGINKANEVVGIYESGVTELIFEGRLSVPEPSMALLTGLVLLAGLVFARSAGQRFRLSRDTFTLLF